MVTPANRDDVQQQVRDIMQRWHQAFAAEWHAEDLTELRRLIGASQGPLNDLSLLRHEIWKTLGAVDETEAQLRLFVHAHTDAIGVAAISLGEWLERRVCPREVGILSCSHTSPSDFAASQASSWSASPQAEPTDSPAFRFLAAGDAVLLPPEGWLAGCETRWQEFLSSCSCENEVLFPCDVAMSDQSPTQFLLAAENRIFGVIQEIDRGRTEGTHEHGEPGYLGLTLEQNRYFVRRAGMEGEVDLSNRRIQWEILVILERRRERWTDLKDLEEAWENLERQVPVRKAMRNQILDLAPKMESLGITIANSRNTGWRLTDGRNYSESDV